MAKEKILVIDDDPGTCRTLNHILKEKGFIPYTVNTGQDGIEAGKTNSFDIALIDLMLPDMPGLDVLERIKDLSPHTEAVVITGHGSLDTAVQAMQDSAYSYVTKPIDMDYLLATISKALEKEKLELERKKAEKALRESEAKYSNLVERAKDGIVITKDGVIQYANPAHAELLGYTVEELSGIPFLNTIAPEYEETATQRCYWRPASIEAPERYEIKVLRKDGTTRDVEVYGELTEFKGEPASMTVFRDITERRQAEEDLRQSEEKFAKAFQSNPALMAISTLKGNRFIEVNNSFLQTLGFEKDEVIGKTNAELAIFVNAKYRDDLRQAVRDNGFARNLEVTVQSKNGELRYGSLSADIIKLRNQRCLLTVMTDITERKQAEEQVRASLEEKEVLLKEIHHRVKNNLQVVSSMLYLQSQNIRDKRIRESLKESQDRVRSMALVHEQLYESKNLSHIDFTSYIQNVTDYLLQSYGIDKSLITIKTDTGDYSFGVDTGITCGLIISELVSNSLKHAFPSGKANHTNKGEILISLRQHDNNQLTLEVGDNGIGLAKKIDFRNTDSLGLRLVHMLTRQLSGVLDVERHNGTTFKITFAHP